MRRVGPVEVRWQGSRRRWPRAGLNRAGGKDTWVVGLWVAGGGRMLSLSRDKWWERRATWRNQAICALRGRVFAVLRALDIGGGTVGPPPDGHHRVRVVTKGGLEGDTPDEARVTVLESRVECSRCGEVLEGTQWVNR